MANHYTDAGTSTYCFQPTNMITHKTENTGTIFVIIKTKTKVKIYNKVSHSVGWLTD